MSSRPMRPDTELVDVDPTERPRRLRLLSVQIAPQFVLDDGDTLTPINPQPQTLPAAEWANVVDVVAHATKQLAEQLGADL